MKSNGQVSSEKISGKRSAIIFVPFFSVAAVFFQRPRKQSRALAHHVSPEAFYAAAEDGEIWESPPVRTEKLPPCRFKQRTAAPSGFVMGSFAWLQLKRELENRPYPFPLEPAPAPSNSRDDPKHLGQASPRRSSAYLFGYPVHAYVLEVADTNAPAVRLYEKLGFREFLRVPNKYSKQSGINAFVYMKYGKENDPRP
jgi:hypothetical protein